MTLHLQKEIEALKKMILALGAMVEEELKNAVISLEEMNSKTASQVVESDSEVDEKEVEIEEECLKILALHQPVAIDLRFIVAVLKINSDLERIGDLAVNIAERTLYLADKEQIEVDVDYRGMAHKARTMVQNSLDSLVNLDAGLAHQVCEADDEVDDLNREIFEKVQEMIRQNPERMDFLLHYMLVARHLERIADHATNVAEDVIYMVEGEIVRHKLGQSL